MLLLVFVGSLICGTESPVILGQKKPPASADASIGELSAQSIFKRYSSRVLFLTCQIDNDDTKIASGVLLSTDGYIATNAHVVEGCEQMSATMTTTEDSSRDFSPVLKYYDAKSDVAILKVEATNLPFIPLAPHAPEIGERVYAIGNPRGLAQSITEGIVSGNRAIEEIFWIQHSAPISPGSSGGALISAHGELVGINSYMLKESQNLNFAVPSLTITLDLSIAKAKRESLPFPLSNDLSGTYSGTVRNLVFGQTANFTVRFRKTTGAEIEGCMAVDLPLIGSGRFQGKASESDLSFTVAGDSSDIEFLGQRTQSGLTGTYTVTRACY